MKVSWFSLYNLILALWVGGVAIFTFVVTPAIFRSYGRDMAGEIVGRLFPGYFFYNLVLTAAALVLFFLLAADRSAFPHRLSLFLLSAAFIVNVFIVFKLHPEAVKVKQEVSSFERESPDSPARKKFRRLHGVSAALNLFLLADGITLLIAGPLLKK
jgi:Ca2+/Na+ antiporter